MRTLAKITLGFSALGLLCVSTTSFAGFWSDIHRATNIVEQHEDSQSISPQSDIHMGNPASNMGSMNANMGNMNTNMPSMSGMSTNMPNPNIPMHCTHTANGESCSGHVSEQSSSSSSSSSTSAHFHW